MHCWKFQASERDADGNNQSGSYPQERLWILTPNTKRLLAPSGNPELSRIWFKVKTDKIIGRFFPFKWKILDTHLFQRIETCFYVDVWDLISRTFKKFGKLFLIAVCKFLLHGADPMQFSKSVKFPDQTLMEAFRLLVDDNSILILEITIYY